MVHLLPEEGVIDGQRAYCHLREHLWPGRRAHRLGALAGVGRAHCWAERRLMGRLHTALVLAVGPAMGGDEGPLMLDWHRLPRSPLDLHTLPHIGRRHRVAVGLDRAQAITGY